jgi:hypothetical protein
MLTRSTKDLGSRIVPQIWSILQAKSASERCEKEIGFIAELWRYGNRIGRHGVHPEGGIAFRSGLLRASPFLLACFALHQTLKTDVTLPQNADCSKGC